jgi:cyclohexanone monooxygenase
MPNIPGIENFKGQMIHTAAWPNEPVDFTGKTVGVIGTGSSGLQVSPQIAVKAQKLLMFQRSAAYSIPAQNRRLTEADYEAFLSDLAEFDAKALKHRGGISTERPDCSVQDVDSQELERRLQERWSYGGAFTFLSSFNDIQLNETSNQLVADFVRARIRATVKNPVLAEKLCPDYLLATRRTCVDTGYYEMFNRDNVELVDVAEDAIVAFTENGVLLSSGKEYLLDCLVLATGYDAMTGAFLAVDVRGRDGLSNRDAWAEGPRSYLGLMVAGFPNLFTVTGPGSPSVLTNVIRSIEHHVDWLTRCFEDLRARDVETIEASAEAQAAWVAHVNDLAHQTLFVKSPSWYCGSDIPGKPKVFTPYAGGLPAYREKADAIAANDYEGFEMKSYCLS